MVSCPYTEETETLGHSKKRVKGKEAKEKKAKRKGGDNGKKKKVAAWGLQRTGKGAQQTGLETKVGRKEWRGGLHSGS